MEGFGSVNDLQLMSLDFGWNDYDASQSADNLSYQHYFLADGSDGFNYVCPPLPQWIQCQQNNPNHVEFHAQNGVSDLQGHMSRTNISDLAFQRAVSFLDMDLQQAIHARLQNESSTTINNFFNPEHQICAQAQNSSEGHCEAYQPNSSVFPPKPRRKASMKKAATTERLRKLRITERVNALQELLPQSIEGDQANVLDGIIDHIKNLQGQIEDLSQNRLGGEPTSNPFISLEGHGHYLDYEQMLKQSVEEMIGKLMEMNPSAAGQLLQSKGLFLMPMAFAGGLHRAA